jgi:signal transduction protein with GAF and PtsI domain
MTMTAELQAGVSATRALFGAAACSCALAAEDGAALRFVAADGVGAAEIIGVTLPVGRGIAGWVALTGQPIAVGDVTRDERFARDIAEATEYVPTSILAAPLLTPEGETIGVIEVLDPLRTDDLSALGGQRGTGAELAALTVVASQISTVVRLSGLVDSVPGVPPELVPALATLTSMGDGAIRLAREVLESVATYARGLR